MRYSFLEYYLRTYSIMLHHLQLVGPHYSIAQQYFHSEVNAKHHWFLAVLYISFLDHL